MADPLTVATGVVGIVMAAAKLSLLLTEFTKNTNAAPQQAKAVLTEVRDIGEILEQLQPFLGTAPPDRSRSSLLKVDKVVTIVSGCVLTFSELEKLLDEMKTEDLNILDRFKWVRKKSTIGGLIQRLQNHKASLSLVFDILNGFVSARQTYFWALVLRFCRYTIAEAKDSVDQLHALVESCYKDMSSRVQALELLSLQKDDDSWTPGDDSESLATIRAHPFNLSSEESSDSFDFSDELQRSRVYKRNQAFRRSVISALTNSVYSTGWSCVSDLSMADVSNISVVNLAITESEVFNPRRSSQTWSAQTDQEVSTNRCVAEVRSRLYEIAHDSSPGAIPQEVWPTPHQTQQRSSPKTRSPLTQGDPDEDFIVVYQPQQLFEGEESVMDAESLDPTSTVSQPHLSDPPSLSQDQAGSSPQAQEQLEDEAAYPCKGCGEVLSASP